MRLLSTNKKPSKKEAFDILLYSKNSAVPNQLSDVEIDKLLNYFAPPVPKVAKTVEQWVAKAVAKNDVREYLNYLYVKNNIVYGCDGSCVFWGATLLGDGYYEPKTLIPVDINAKYPDIERVVNIADASSYTSDLTESSVIFRKLHCYTLHGVNYQKIFIDNAVNGETSITFDTSATGDKLRGTSQFGEFVVMCIRDVKNARS